MALAIMASLFAASSTLHKMHSERLLIQYAQQTASIPEWMSEEGIANGKELSTDVAEQTAKTQITCLRMVYTNTAEPEAPGDKSAGDSPRRYAVTERAYYDMVLCSPGIAE